MQRGAAQVLAIDVGYGQLAWKLRQDTRVTVLERTNVRYLTSLPGVSVVDLVTIDVSFIGLNLVIPPVLSWLRAPRGSLIALIKPQFEADRQQVGNGGVVRDPLVHHAVLEHMLIWAQRQLLDVLGLMRSPVTGPAGNIEFLVWLRPGGGTGDVSALVTLSLIHISEPTRPY